MERAIEMAIRMRRELDLALSHALTGWRDRTASTYRHRHHDPITTALSDYQRSAEAFGDTLQEAERAGRD